MDENQKRLEALLLEVIEKEVKEPSPEIYMHEIAMVAHELIQLWSINI